jgi:radical SAM protein with 4Fe4S-binding SPASM domain
VFSKLISATSQMMANPRAFGYPAHLTMEISSACQLRCPLCPIGNDSLTRKPESMTMETYKKVVDEIGDYLYHINLNGMGEPTLNKNIVEMIEYAKKKDIFVDLYSNFQLQNKEMIEGLITSKLDVALIAVDGATKESYEHYRVGGQFETIKENIRYLVEARKRLNSKTPEINIQFINFDFNKKELNLMKELVKELGADNLYVKRPFMFWGSDDKEKDRNFMPKEEDDNVSLYQSDESGDISWIGTPKKMCELLWSSAVVLADGSITPCCFDYDGKVAFGNVRETSFRRIWNNNKYRRFRNQNKKDWKSIPLCHDDFEGGCPNMFMQPDDWLIKFN